ncbi:hypothetical protein MY8738_009360 [Beauveria namnaoensis]
MWTPPVRACHVGQLLGVGGQKQQKQQKILRFHNGEFPKLAEARGQLWDEIN